MPTPDKHIHPIATGLAKETVDRHQDEQDIEFWSAWFCPFNQRIWMALEERKVPYHYHEVNPYKKEKDFLRVNPLGLVPAIEHHGHGTLYESDVLCEYIEDLYPPSKEHPSIFPSGLYEKNWARLNIDHISKKVIPHYFKLQQAQTESDQAAARNDFYSGLRTLAERVKEPYFAGDQWTVVDMSIAPFVRRFVTWAKYRGLQEEDIGEKWMKYRTALMDRDSLKRTTSQDEHYVELIGRYLRNEAQSEVAKATRSGKNLP